MKTYMFKTIFTIALIILTFTGRECYSDAAARTYIMSKLKFYYVANPNTDSTRTVLNMNANARDARDVCGGNAAMNPMKNFLKALLNDHKNGGDESFQFAVREILRIREKLIAVFLYNDAVPFNNFAMN